MPNKSFLTYSTNLLVLVCTFGEICFTNTNTAEAVIILKGVISYKKRPDVWPVDIERYRLPVIVINNDNMPAI